MNLVLVSSFSDLNILKQKKYKKVIIASPYTSVTKYFNESNINCIDLNSLISDNYKIKSYQKLQKKYYSIFEKKNENIFHLFRHSYLYSFVGLIYLDYTIKLVIKNKKIKKIYIIDSIKNKLNDFFLYDNLIATLKNINLPLNIILEEKFLNNYGLKQETLYLKKILRNILSSFNNLKNNFFLSKKNQNILIMNNNHKNIKNYNGFKHFYPKKNNFIKGFKMNFNFSSSNQITNQKFFFGLYFENFYKLNRNYIDNELLKFKNILKKKNIKQVAWLESPNDLSMEAIFSNYCIKKKIKVDGFQHGGGAGFYKENNPINIIYENSDYLYCNNFYSYSNFQLKNKRIKTKIIQKKFFENINIKTNNKKIIFVPQIISSVLEPKFGLNSHGFYKTQKKILDTLSKSNYEIYIKLYPSIGQNFIEKYYPIVNYVNKLSKKYENIKIIDTKGLLDSIKIICPETIVFDYFSTPIWEVFKLPIRIFVLHDDKYFVLKKDLYNICKERLFFYKNIDNLKNNIFINNYKKNYKNYKNNKNYKNFII